MSACNARCLHIRTSIYCVITEKIRKSTTHKVRKICKTWCFFLFVVRGIWVNIGDKKRMKYYRLKNVPKLLQTFSHNDKNFFYF
jgi:hypothetical protein